MAHARTTLAILVLQTAAWAQSPGPNSVQPDQWQCAPAITASKVEAGEVVVQGTVLAETVGHLRLASGFPGSSSTQQLDAAIRNCREEACVVLATPGMAPGDPTPSTWLDKVGVVDFRYNGGLKALPLARFYSPLQVIRAKNHRFGNKRLLQCRTVLYVALQWRVNRSPYGTKKEHLLRAECRTLF